MSSPNNKFKPYSTGARPNTRAEKRNVHMRGPGWVREITATDYAWAGNDNTSADPEILVAFNGHKLGGWYGYTYWVQQAWSEAAPAAISLHVHFNGRMTVTGTPTCEITNNQAGGGTAASILASYASGSGGSILTFTTATPAANAFKEDDVVYLDTDCLALAGGAIVDRGTSNAALITSAADRGYRASSYNHTHNWGGNANTSGVAETNGPRILWNA